MLNRTKHIIIPAVPIIQKLHIEMLVTVAFKPYIECGLPQKKYDHKYCFQDSSHKSSKYQTANHISLCRYLMQSGVNKYSFEMNASG